MSPDFASFETVLTGLREGRDDAFRRLFAEYTGRLKALARGKIGERLRGRGEESDIVQSLWASFDRRVKKGEFDGLGGWNELWSLLACVTVRKCADRARYFAAAMRAEPTVGGLPEVDRAGGEPTPDEEAVFAEEYERLFAGLDDRDRQIVSLHLQGLSVEEISAEAQWSERTVARVLGTVREQLELAAAG